VDVEFNCTTHHIQILYSLVVIMSSSSHCMCVRASFLLIVVTRFILGFVLLCIDSFLVMFFFFYFPLLPCLEQLNWEGIRLHILIVKDFICHSLWLYSQIAAGMPIYFTYHGNLCWQWGKLEPSWFCAGTFLVAICPFISLVFVLLFVIILFFSALHQYEGTTVVVLN
jgi:hypothetical protein